jgi:hypothetical protein
MKRKLEELEYETRNMSIMIQKMDKCFEMLRQGAITDYECKQFLRAAMFQHLPQALLTTEPIPSIDPLCLFWSAVVNWLFANIRQQTPIRVKLTFAEVEHAYKAFFEYYVVYPTTTTEKLLLVDTSLMRPPSMDPHAVRLHQLMLVQKNREMTFLRGKKLNHETAKVFGDSVTINSPKNGKNCHYDFYLASLQRQLINGMPYQATGYDPGVLLSKPIKFTVM